MTKPTDPDPADPTNTGDLSTLECGLIALMLIEQCRELGQMLADRSGFGTVVAVGDQRKDNPRKRWVVALATNDIAEHLEGFLREQAAIRAEAGKKAGNAPDVFVGSAAVSAIERSIGDALAAMLQKDAEQGEQP